MWVVSLDPVIKRIFTSSTMSLEFPGNEWITLSRTRRDTSWTRRRRSPGANSRSPRRISRPTRSVLLAGFRHVRSRLNGLRMELITCYFSCRATWYGPGSQSGHQEGCGDEKLWGSKYMVATDFLSPITYLPWLHLSLLLFYSVI